MTETKEKQPQKSTSVFSLQDFNSKTNLTSGEKGAAFEDYDLGEHRDPETSISSKSALAHLLKSSLGSGILAMPLAFKNAGLAFGLITTLFVGFLCTHCVHILVKTSQSMSKQLRVPSLSYAETTREVFDHGPEGVRRYTKFAYNFVDIGMIVTYYAATTVYIVFIATSIYEVVNYDLEINLNIRIYIAITVIPCLLIGQIRNLKYLVPFSAMANVFIVIVFGITLYYMFNEPLSFSGKPLIANWKQLPFYFATVIFAMEGIGVVMPVENSMKRPQDFLGCPSVLNISMAFVVSLYAIIGFFGYVRFGEEVRGSITLNLPKGEILADVGKILMALAILFTYGLQFYVPNDLLWTNIKHKFDEKNHNRAIIILRAGSVLISGSIAAAIPNLEPFISLVGSVCFSLIGLTAPCVVETIYLWPNGLGWCKWRLIKNILCILFSIFALFTGAFVSIKDIIEAY